MKIIRERIRNLHDYIFDPAVNLRDRAFVVFSSTVLIALFLAIPAGLIMREPLSATISTLVGAIFFSAVVIYSYRTKTIKRARIAISVILVLVFLPAMFFTNGGVEGGTPIWLLLGTIYIAMILDGKLKYFMLILNAIIMIICWIIGYYNEDLIIEYSRFGNYFDSIAGLFIVSVIVYILITFQINLYRNEEQQKNIQRLFEQTATALVNAIDAKDKYTHGHSSRVAEYSRRIAEKAGKSRKECDEIYYIALLHDVGKIGVPEGIINKEGKLTEEEYNTIKAHTDLGAQILQSISEYPYLSIGAHFHHERYDGKGYPQKLKGSDIPEIARIISVADAYDAMTSKRSYRDPIPQQKVREEIVKGIGTQFDPDFARYMVHFIDLDLEYDMQEKEEIKELAGKDELIVSEHRSTVSDGILLNTFQTIITMKIGPDVSNPAMPPKPSLLLFDSLDARYHDGENEIRDLLYFEYGEIRFDGTAETKEIRKIQTNTVRNNSEHKPEKDEYRIEGLKIKDHLRIRIIGKENIHEIIMALPDSTRYAYLGLTGEYCHIDDVRIEKSVNEAPQDTIPRIAEEISYINVPAGDVPNVQIDGYRTAATDGIPIKDGMQISFHAFGLPTARLVWHCPFINIFDSDDGKVNGQNYHDYTLMRLDGECWEGDPKCSINLLVNKGDDFNGWDAWKKQVKEGIDCTVNIERKDNVITVRTENAGISIKNVSTITDGRDTVYVALTGDQCALTNIRIKYQN